MIYFSLILQTALVLNLYSHRGARVNFLGNIINETEMCLVIVVQWNSTIENGVDTRAFPNDS